MPSTRMFDARSKEVDLRHWLGMPMKGIDRSIDSFWKDLMDAAADAYYEAKTNTTVSWTALTLEERDTACSAVMQKWAEKAPHWSILQLEQTALWKLQKLHKRERDNWWQKRKGGRAARTRSPSHSDETEYAAASPTSRREQYDPVRDAAAQRS